MSISSSSLPQSQHSKPLSYSPPGKEAKAFLHIPFNVSLGTLEKRKYSERKETLEKKGTKEKKVVGYRV